MPGPGGLDPKLQSIQKPFPALCRLAPPAPSNQASCGILLDTLAPAIWSLPCPQSGFLPSLGAFPHEITAFWKLPYPCTPKWTELGVKSQYSTPH